MKTLYRRRGFSLPETLVALLVFALVSTGFLSSYVAAMRTQKMSGDYYLASCLARNRIQRALRVDFNSIPLMVETLAPVDEDGNLSINGRFKRTTIVTAKTATTYDVLVKVSYKPPASLSSVTVKPVEVRTLVHEKMLSTEL